MLVPGGTGGLGLAVAQKVLDSGRAVVLFARDADAGQRAAQRLGPKAVFTPGDVTDEAAVKRAVDAAVGLGRLCATVNCAGGGRAMRTVGRQRPCPLPDFAGVIETHLTGSFNVVRLAAQRMTTNELVAGERGVLVNVSSIAAFDGQAGQSAYAAAKAGIVGMTLPLARELAPWSIRCVTLAPGLFETEQTRILPDAVRESLRSTTVYPHRFGDPGEFAALVVHVLDNPMINGAVLRLDGAVRMPPR
ncbi:SDR family NAD(P)-dependent oxidoreductase [Streptomyces sp. NBC_01314]|uniref:SDR family NAD(P)-dependent oxidoreductase n=1 Tax=Streptomyces sp. NBC_01314 TaxID=2903821 RepID=UPI003084B4FA|nr:SDR family NAD(P)-dependent oxidoreductase [Streptomyces sp. NBC_01314]